MNRYKTPLRYPGGKQRLAPFIAEVLRANDLEGGDYVEPFAGGAGVAIDLLMNGVVSRVHLNDLSQPVYDFWRVVLTQSEEFCALIASASLTIKEWRRQKEILSQPRGHDQLARAFSFFYLNRCNRSGIVSGGCIGGLHQSGDWRIGARFPRYELIRRVEMIAAKRKCIAVRKWDAEVFLTDYVSTLPTKTLVYCDPPYFNKAERLYLNHFRPEDHASIAEVVQAKVKHPWLVSYDAAPPIMEHYAKRRSFTYDLQYNAAKAYKGREVFIVADSVSLPATSTVKSIDAVLGTVPKLGRCKASGIPKATL
jgi:DNA adenine methylase